MLQSVESCMTSLVCHLCRVCAMKGPVIFSTPGSTKKRGRDARVPTSGNSVPSVRLHRPPGLPIVLKGLLLVQRGSTCELLGPLLAAKRLVNGLRGRSRPRSWVYQPALLDLIPDQKLPLTHA